MGANHDFVDNNGQSPIFYAIKYNKQEMVEYLIKEKVPYLFGVCGHGNIGFLDAAASAQDRIRTISVHHEQAAGYMADAYYKVKHQPVATYTSCGPGSCNLPVALAGAMMDSSSFLAITGNARSADPVCHLSDHHHVIVNALTDVPSVTLHVYGGEMREPKVYLPTADPGRYTESVRPLSYHA